MVSGRPFNRPGREASTRAPESGWKRPNFEHFLAIRRFTALDGLRAVSVLGVVWQHTSGMPGPVFLHRGYLGVDFFFAISGFLITSLLVREFDSNGAINLRKFYARRALRIFPLYYATLLAYVALIVVTRRQSVEGAVFFHHLVNFATYTFNWFSGDQETFNFAWSLATEEQFYLFWPPLLLAALVLGGGKRVWPALLSLAALIVVSQSALLCLNTSVLPWRIPASLSLAILLGAAAALALSSRRGFTALNCVVGQRWSAPVAAVVLAAAVEVDAPQRIVEVLMVAVVCAVSIAEWTPLHPVLRWRPLAFVGVISYGVYLLHNLCANVARVIAHEQQGVRTFAITTVAVILMSHMSFRFFETPVLKLKRRYETTGERDGDELSRIAALRP